MRNGIAENSVCYQGGAGCGRDGLEVQLSLSDVWFKSVLMTEGVCDTSTPLFAMGLDYLLLKYHVP